PAGAQTRVQGADRFWTLGRQDVERADHHPLHQGGSPRPAGHRGRELSAAPDRELLLGGPDAGGHAEGRRSGAGGAGPRGAAGAGDPLANRLATYASSIPRNSVTIPSPFSVTLSLPST